MSISPFKLERYFAKYEFKTPYLLSCSDCEALTLNELLEMADDDSKKLWENLSLSYTESNGHHLLRDEISKSYNSIHPENVLVATPEEGIYITMNSILKSGDHVVCTFPGYQSLYEIANNIGCDVTRWSPVESQNGWVFDIQDLTKLVRSNTKLLIINFPHNPTGTTISEEELLQIIEIAKQNNIVIFSDEMYRYLEYKDDDRLPSSCDLYSNAISLFGMSKSFALPGLRIGWLTTQNRELLNAVSIYKDYTTICSSAPSEILAIMALKNRKTILQRNMSIINKNLNLLDDFFLQFNHLFDWQRPNAGPVAFPAIKLNIHISDFCKDLVDKKGVLLVPSNQFDFGDSHFRVGFARENLPQALHQFEQYVQENYS